MILNRLARYHSSYIVILNKMDAIESPDNKRVNLRLVIERQLLVAAAASLLSVRMTDEVLPLLVFEV